MAQRLERRNLTVFFCDLIGSTELSTRLDPEELHDIHKVYRASYEHLMDKHAGYPAKYMGDGLMALFGFPQANEDDAERAVRAALELVDTLPTLQNKYGVTLRARVGIATGPVLVGDLVGGDVFHEPDVVGEAPNLAARLQQIASPNSVVISAETRRRVGQLFNLSPLEPQTLKGFSAPVAAWEVSGVSPIESRFRALRTMNSRTVNRVAELGLMLSRWREAATGQGCVVLVSGEPGIGKSRLVQTLLDRISDEPHIPLRFFCMPNAQSSALYPVIAQLQRTAGIERSDDVGARLDKLEAVLAQGVGDPGEAVPLIAELLSIPAGERYPAVEISPQKRREKTLAALIAQLEGLARQPVIIVFEDVHWIDPTSMELLATIAERAPKLSAMMIVTFRPGGAPPWAHGPRVTEVRLDRLPVEHRKELVAELTRDNLLPSSTVERIVDRAGGVPLFIEELTKALVERGDDQPAAHEIPASLQDMLAARIDRLGSAKELAQIASVIGTEFTRALLIEVSGMDENRIDTELAQLIASEIVIEEGEASGAHYRFRHALLQETSYASLLKSTRQTHHLTIAQTLMQRFPEICEARPELLAYHFTNADMKEEAIPFWRAAGEQSVRRSANLEAIAHFSKALDLLKALAPKPEHFQLELGLQLALGTPLIATKGFASPDVGKVYARAKELCQQAGDAPQLFPVLWGLWVFYTAGAKHEVARDLAAQCQRIVDATADEDLEMLAHHAMGVTLTGLAQFPEALRELDQAIAIYDRRQPAGLAFVYGQDSGVVCRSQAAFVLWFLGKPEQALRRDDEALALARKLSHPYSLAASLVFSAWIRQLLGDGPAARERTEEALALSASHEFVFWLLTGMVLHGWALSQGGEADAGLAEIRQGVTGYQATGAAIMLPYYLSLLAGVCSGLGQIAEAQRLLADADAALTASGERWFEAEVHRLTGEAALLASESSGPSAQNEKIAEDLLEKALRVASEQGFRSLELRAAMSLTRLHERRGAANDARQRLLHIYNEFTEGFGTADLQEARALLGT